MEFNYTRQRTPPEICTQILSYLPVKSLLRFRSVEQEWKSMIDSRDFASLHLSRYSHNRLETRLIVLEMSRLEKPSAWLLSRCPLTQQYQQTSEMEFPVLPESLLSTLGSPVISDSIDGLLLVKQPWGENYTVLWNPSLRKTLHIPLPPCDIYQSRTLCLGFDPSTNDYKVVCLVRDCVLSSITIQVFSLNSRLWKSRGDAHLKFVFGSDEVYFDGSVYWVGDSISDHKKGFVSFNMTSDTLSHIPLPNMSYEPHMKRVDVPIVLGGSSIGLLTSFNGTTEILVLESDSCWSKRFRFNIRIPRKSCFCLHLNKYGLLIWKSDSKDTENDSEDKYGFYTTIYAYDINIGKTSVLSHEYVHWPSDIGSYMESLVLLRE